MAVKTGDLITVVYEEREFEAIVVDPDGLGPGLPSVGFGMGMTHRTLFASSHAGGRQPQSLTAKSNRCTSAERFAKAAIAPFKGDA